MIEKGRWEPFSELAKTAIATRTWGDAYGHALVATGRVEAMIDPTVSRWDLSAVGIVVQEAGGKFTDLSGGPALTRDDRLEALSSNGHVHDEIVRAFGTPAGDE